MKNYLSIETNIMLSSLNQVNPNFLKYLTRVLNKIYNTYFNPYKTLINLQIFLSSVANR